MMDMHLHNVSYNPGLLFPTYIYIVHSDWPTLPPNHQLCGRVPLHPGDTSQCILNIRCVCLHHLRIGYCIHVIDMCTKEIQYSAGAKCLLFGEYHEFDWSEMLIASLLLMTTMVMGAGERWFGTS